MNTRTTKRKKSDAHDPGRYKSRNNNKVQKAKQTDVTTDTESIQHDISKSPIPETTGINNITAANKKSSPINDLENSHRFDTKLKSLIAAGRHMQQSHLHNQQSPKKTTTTGKKYIMRKKASKKPINTNDIPIVKPSEAQARQPTELGSLTSSQGISDDETTLFDNLLVQMKVINKLYDQVINGQNTEISNDDLLLIKKYVYDIISYFNLHHPYYCRPTDSKDVNQVSDKRESFKNDALNNPEILILLSIRLILHLQVEVDLPQFASFNESLKQQPGAFKMNWYIYLFLSTTFGRHNSLTNLTQWYYTFLGSHDRYTHRQ